MADEISVSLTLSAINGKMKLPAVSSAFRANQTTARFSSNVQNIGTTHEALTIGGDISTAGWGIFQNNDSTNYVDIGVDVSGTFHPLARIKAGESHAFRLATNSPYAKANTAAVNLQYTILAD